MDVYVHALVLCFTGVLVEGKLELKIKHILTHYYNYSYM